MSPMASRIESQTASLLCGRRGEVILMGMATFDVDELLLPQVVEYSLLEIQILVDFKASNNLLRVMS